MAPPFGVEINNFIGVEKQETDHNPGLFDQHPGENPKKPPLLTVSSKMAQPFWLSSVLSKSDTLLGVIERLKVKRARIYPANRPLQLLPVENRQVRQIKRVRAVLGEIDAHLPVENKHGGRALQRGAAAIDVGELY